MATIEKISGTSWRISKFYNGRRYRLVLNRKPTKKEAERLIWALIEKEPEQGYYQSFEVAAQKYIESKSSILSPSTIRSYASALKNTPQFFKIKPISGISDNDIQLCINEYANGRSAKTVRNLSAFISVVMKTVRPKYTSMASLPQKIKTEFYVPEDEDVKRILNASKGTRYEIPLWLAVFGLRRSEVCALLTSDLSKDNIITVSKAKVEKSDGGYVIKTTKTVDSTRKVAISSYVADLIRELPEGEVYPYSPNQILKYLHDTQEKLGIPKFKLHALRHFFASTAREIMGDSYVEKMGGWRPGSDIMKKVYDYTKRKQEKESQEAFARKMDDFMFG